MTFYEGPPCTKCGGTERYTRNHTCVGCQRTYEARHRKNNPEKIRERRLWDLYRLTEEDYQKILEFQNGACYITGRRPAGRFNVDHSHETGLIRGLLSPWANKGLSFFDDDPDQLRRAADYLENPPAVRALGREVYGLLGKARRKKVMIYGGGQ